MSYSSKERDIAILDIGLGKADFKNLPLYKDLQRFGWIVISPMNGYDNHVELTFWGRDLFNRLHKEHDNHPNDLSINT